MSCFIISTIPCTAFIFPTVSTLSISRPSFSPFHMVSTWEPKIRTIIYYLKPILLKRFKCLALGKKLNSVLFWDIQSTPIRDYVLQDTHPTFQSYRNHNLIALCLVEYVKTLHCLLLLIIYIMVMLVIIQRVVYVELIQVDSPTLYQKHIELHYTFYYSNYITIIPQEVSRKNIHVPILCL